MRFIAAQGSVFVEGYDEIGIRWFSLLSPVIRRLFLEKRFRTIWALGWRRLHKRELAADLARRPAGKVSSSGD